MMLNTGRVAEELGALTWEHRRLAIKVCELEERVAQIGSGLHDRRVMDLPHVFYRDEHEISLPWLKAAVDALLAESGLVCEFVEAGYRVKEVETEEEG